MLPNHKPAEDYLRQIDDPYCFICGRTVVKLEFSEEEPSFEDKLINYFINLKNR